MPICPHRWHRTGTTQTPHPQNPEASPHSRDRPRNRVLASIVTNRSTPCWTAIVAVRPSQTTSSEGDSPAPTWTTPAGTRSRRAGIQHRCLICVLKKAQKIRDSQARTGTTHTCNLHNRSCFSTRVRVRPCPRREGIQIQARYLPNRINIGIPSSETFFSLSQPPARLFLQSDLS